MALPKLTTPTYELDLPSTGEKIKYRPFLVKEQKLLMMAEESKEEKQISQTIQQLIGTCTFGKVDAIVSPIFDVEYVFLQLRMRSVGAKIEINITCPDDKKTQVPVKINLEDVNVLNDEKHTNIVQVTNRIKMVMKYPHLVDMEAMKNTTENMFNLLMKCVTEVHDGDTIHNRADINDKELTEFIDSFNTKQLENLMKFFETMPKVRHIVNVTNPKTKVVSEVILEGMDTFLV
tara:strand:- start:342 stop:1040 length:699 start_codon:yes stop_codon:yes gene_type:complete